MAEAKALREKILKLVREYYGVAHKPRKWTVGNRIPYSARVYDENEIETLVDSSLEFWLTAGRFHEKFEKNLAKFCSQKTALAVNSGSSANLVALSSLTSPLLKKKKLRKGDEIITCATSFPTTVNPIVQNGCVPVFLDAEVGTYNMKTEMLEDAISDKTKAIMLAHTLGNPFDLDVIVKFCKKHDLFLIEDCCDALGAIWDGKNVGTFGDFATLSFYPAHHITTGEGG
ncbi:MAG: aminotransferase class I/II-fold pyridoxal phosphate-dependent enzyme, partial [Candidatus Micrarchaeia archaeon]